MTKLTDQINWNELEAIVLDLDGTIYNKHLLAWRIFVRQCRYLRLLLAERRTRRQMRGVDYASSSGFYQRFFSLMAANSHCSLDEVQQWYHDHYLPTMVAVIGQFYQPRPQIMDLLQECQQRQIKVAIYSDYECVQDKLQALHLSATLFNYMTCAADLGGLKPSKVGLTKLMQVLQVESAHCLMIGDRDDTDGASARLVGCHYIHIG